MLAHYYDNETTLYFAPGELNTFLTMNQEIQQDFRKNIDELVQNKIERTHLETNDLHTLMIAKHGPINSVNTFQVKEYEAQKLIEIEKVYT